MFLFYSVCEQQQEYLQYFLLCNHALPDSSMDKAASFPDVYTQSIIRELPQCQPYHCPYLHAAAGGGKASEYFKSGTKGWDYHQYLMLFLMLTPTEKKIIRMTQLIENNVWLMKGYENFQLKNCAVKASFSGKIDVTPFFWKYPQKIQYRFHTEYAY